MTHSILRVQHKNVPIVTLPQIRDLEDLGFITIVDAFLAAYVSKSQAMICHDLYAHLVAYLKCTYRGWGERCTYIIFKIRYKSVYFTFNLF